jgi:hypothetical protein
MEQYATVPLMDAARSVNWIQLISVLEHLTENQTYDDVRQANACATVSFRS